MKYRKKPVVVEAEIYRPGMEDGMDNFCAWYEDFTRNLEPCFICSAFHECNGKSTYWKPFINTFTGKHYISSGDYIITNVKGDRYVCNPDIFALTYEAVEGD